MRLSESERLGIIDSLTAAGRNGSIDIFLCGSRVYDHLKGGDIDLLVIFSDENDAKLAKRNKSDFLVKMKQLIGERKIDLKFCSSSEASSDDFIRETLKEALPLRSK